MNATAYDLEKTYLNFWREQNNFAFLENIQARLKNNSLFYLKSEIAAKIFELYTQVKTKYFSEEYENIVLHYGCEGFEEPLINFVQHVEENNFPIELAGYVVNSFQLPQYYTELSKNYTETEKNLARIKVLAQMEQTQKVEVLSFAEYVYKNSDNYMEVLNAYNMEKLNTPYAKLLEWQKLCLGYKYTKESYCNYFQSGSDFMPNMLKKLQIAAAPKGHSLDVVADEISESCNGIEVTAGMIANFLYEFYSTPGAGRKTTDLMQNLSAKYKLITGKPLPRNGLVSKVAEFSDCPY
jgi:hypothetical protein